MPDVIVKTCTGCGAAFTLEDLVRNADVDPIGMQFIDADAKHNMYYFNHTCPGCGSTFLVPVETFEPLIEEPIPPLPRTGQEDCERRCLHVRDLATCSAPCTYAPYRRLLLRIRERSAATAPPPASPPRPA